MTICGLPIHPGFPDAGEGVCCFGNASRGPEHCTCWQPVYDLEQQTPDTNLRPATRLQMCPDCAYRPGSPERAGDPTFAGDADELERIAGSPTDQFWCHQGLRKPTKWIHPSGAEHPGHPGAYKPPIIDTVPYQADGTPGELCAGWAARRKALAAATSTTRPQQKK